MSTYVEKPHMSLIEKKKQQWAKEREELARINGYWNSDNKDYDKSFERSRYGSKFSMIQNNEQLRRENRRSSLPPLYKNQYNSNEHYEREKERGGETSGYGSDNSPEYIQNVSGYESSSSREDRPRWGDKGVGMVGKFWQPREESFNEVENEPPNWVRRGLKNGEILVSNQSPAESPEQNVEEIDRPQTTGSGSSSNNKTFIRGQNIPVDSMELAERERKRQIAIEHQEAILQQLQEREKKKREEHQKRIKEELEEELRIEREQEQERLRKESELKALREKQEREQKRKQAMQEAIELAEKEAKLQKLRNRIQKQANDINFNNNEPVVEKVDNDKVPTIENDNNKQNNTDLNNKDNNLEGIPVKNTNSKRATSSTSGIITNELNNNNKSNIEKESSSSSSEDIESIQSLENNLHNNSDTSLSNVSNLNNNIHNNNVNNKQLISPRADYQQMIFKGSPLDILQSIPYAVLVPSLNNATPIAVPVIVSDQSSSTSRTENRILTPTQYRIKNKKTCDSSTQTEVTDFRVDSVREKTNNIDLNYDNRSSRKGGRSRQEDRRCESVGERPKWGANRPPTRYLKQSEKELLYVQRRKPRTTVDRKGYDDKNSSDESQTNSPRSYRKKGYIEKRHTRSLWRKSDQIFKRNLNMYQTEMIPLESDKDNLYFKQNYEQVCCCKCRCDIHRNGKVDILKIVDNSPRDDSMQESIEKLPDYISKENNRSDILDKLSSLHNGLMIKQEQWQRSPRTPLLSSSSNKNN